MKSIEALLRTADRELYGMKSGVGKKEIRKKEEVCTFYLGSSSD
jgi:hypothetical protein